MNAIPDHRIAERSRFRRLADLLDRVSGDVWLIEANERGTFVVADRMSGQRVTLCKFGQSVNDDEMRLISEALDVLLFALPMIHRAADRVRSLETRVNDLVAELDAVMVKGGKAGNYTAQASMLLSDPRFQRFLSERRHGEVVDGKETADAALKAELVIESKKEINADDGARQRWFDLRAAFSAWEMG